MTLALPGLEPLRSSFSSFAVRTAIERVDTTALPSAQVLSKKIWEPLQVATGKDIIFVSHKSLHLLPFQAL